MYSIDNSTGDIVISGFEKGIGDSPYTGLFDAKGVNLSSIPGEASVNFSTQSVTPPSIANASMTGVVGSNPNFITFTGATGLENGMCIKFSVLSDATKGLSLNTPYWVGNCSNTGGAGQCTLSAAFAQSSTVSITASITGTFSTYNMNNVVQIVQAEKNNGTATYYMIDALGQVWTNHFTTTSGYWEFTGNTGGSDTGGAGLVFCKFTDGTNSAGFLFAFRNTSIDYVITTNSNDTLSWGYAWNSFVLILGSHYAIRGYDNRVYFCNGYNIQKFFQTSPTTLFDPTNASTYTYSTFNLLPINDRATCLSPIGSNMLIGGKNNITYLWDTTSSVIENYIPLAESYVSQIVTVNVNAYIFAGNRGNIYITNGSQASLFKKIPDHLSNTIEPYFQWQGATYQKNRLYFGVNATNNAGTSIAGYGGVWCIDLTTGAIYLSNQLSYGNYNSNTYSTAILSIPASSSAGGPTGVGFYVGWFNGSTYGLDKSISTPYIGGQSYIISDAIPIGTALKPITASQLEFKLSTPLLTSETIELQVASSIGGTFTSVMTTNGDDSLISANSGSFPIQEQQWILVKAILTGKALSPSYNRLKEIRIIGATLPFKSMSTIE